MMKNHFKNFIWYEFKNSIQNYINLNNFLKIKKELLFCHKG